MSRRVKLKLIRDAIPRSLKTIYNAHSAGRISWASRINNEGRFARDLYIDIELLQRWACDEGIDLNLRLIEEAGRR